MLYRLLYTLGLTLLVALGAAVMFVRGGEPVPVYGQVRVCDGFNHCHYETRIVGYQAEPTVADYQVQAAPAAAPAKSPAFYPGARVKHAANAGGLFPAGTGVVVDVILWNTGDGYSYQVRCDLTGQVLPVNFKASELTAIHPMPQAGPPPVAAAPPACASCGQEMYAEAPRRERPLLGAIAERFQRFRDERPKPIRRLLGRVAGGGRCHCR